jgi:alpha-1,3-rhamnosyl/mannosyltransferase
VASHVLTDSEFSRSEIAAAYRIPFERITVAPLGVSLEFGPGEPSLPEALPAGIVGPFFLHVGDLHERRNLTVVVRAVVEARRRAGPTAAPSLVLAGIDRGVGDSLEAMASASGAADVVVRLGVVPEPTLRALYRAATALVYPSRYEGFGLPVLEAMASGTPVIASRATSLPEVVGEAGLLLDPDDVHQWADAIVSVMNDAGLRGRLRQAGVARAAQFTWARTARITLGVYRRVTERT